MSWDVIPFLVVPLEVGPLARGVEEPRGRVGERTRLGVDSRLGEPGEFWKERMGEVRGDWAENDIVGYNVHMKVGRLQAYGTAWTMLLCCPRHCLETLDPWCLTDQVEEGIPQVDFNLTSMFMLTADRQLAGPKVAYFY